MFYLYSKFIDKGQVEEQASVIKENRKGVLEKIEALKKERKTFASLSEQIQSHCNLLLDNELVSEIKKNASESLLTIEGYEHRRQDKLKEEKQKLEDEYLEFERDIEAQKKEIQKKVTEQFKHAK